MDRSAAATSRSTTSAAWAKSSARSWARCCRSTGSWPPRARSKSPPRPTTIPFCRCSAIPTSPRVSHPDVPLPPRFRYPDDARRQLALAREYCAQNFGVAPVGLWPSEGSVSDEVFAIAAELGFEWAATDSGVLDRTLGRGVPVDGLYRPYRWQQGGRKLGVIFRDHFLSDLIGFVYSKMDAARGGRRFPAPHPRELRAAFWQPAAMPWCPSFSTAKTPGNITTATAAPSCASCTAASPRTRGCAPSPSAKRCG